MKPLLAGLVSVFALPAIADAHVLDQYVQAAQIALASDGARVELRMTPGVQISELIFRSIDTNDDGLISRDEEQAYARQVLKSLAAEADGRRVPLALEGARFPSRAEMNEGVGAIRLELRATTPLGEGAHELSFRNDYLPGMSVYLANALAPTGHALEITQQQRDPLQHELRIAFRVLPGEAHTTPGWVLVVLVGLCSTLLLSLWIRQFVMRSGSADRFAPDQGVV